MITKCRVRVLKTYENTVTITSSSESWVEVQDRGEGAHGRLAHPSSKEELKQMLACAASEEEEELSDTDVV